MLPMGKSLAVVWRTVSGATMGHDVQTIAQWCGVVWLDWRGIVLWSGRHGRLCKMRLACGEHAERMHIAFARHVSVMRHACGGYAMRIRLECRSHSTDRRDGFVLGSDGFPWRWVPHAGLSLMGSMRAFLPNSIFVRPKSRNGNCETEMPFASRSIFRSPRSSRRNENRAGKIGSAFAQVAPQAITGTHQKICLPAQIL